jgi:predicted deacylase
MKKFMRRDNRKKLVIGGEVILPGQRKRISLAVAALFDYTEITIPIEVIRGTQEGPVLFISAAIHGDEISGTEIIKRIMQDFNFNQLTGTVILIPVVNIYGFNNKSRYLPDGRDLNRSFPGNLKGSLASRIAHVFMKEVVSKCTHGIDLHSGSNNRTNLPQVRACLDDDETQKLAMVFGAPVVINSKLRDGSLRDAARKRKVKVLLYEGGEALRFEEPVIRAGLKGCQRIMQAIGMIKSKKVLKKEKSFSAKWSYWVRAPHSGSFRCFKKLGDYVEEGQLIAVISDTFGQEPYKVNAGVSGVIIGMSLLPLVNQGDAMVHIAVSKEKTSKERDGLIDRENLNF